MPLAQGKSEKSFKKNVKTEMDEGKPQKQALAIAYAVKKRMQKKAHGGTIEGPDEMGRSYDRPGHQESQENQMLNPSRGSGTGVMGKVLGQHRLSGPEQAHGQLPQPEQPGARYQPSRGTNPIRPEPTQAQAKFSPDEQAAHLAAGGQVKAAMSRRDRALFAARGDHMSHHDPSHLEYAEKYPSPGSSPNQGAQGRGHPPSHQPMVSEPPQRISEEEQAMFAEGGPVKMAEHHRKRAEHYERMAGGGMAEAPKEAEVEERDPFAAQTGAGALQSGMKDFISGGAKKMGVGKKMAHGGYADPELGDDQQSQFYDRGGITRQGTGGNQISSPRAPQKAMPQSYGKHPYQIEGGQEEGERFALGGYATGGAIAKRIREQKRMAFGGRAHEDDDRPEGGESIDNFRRADHPDNDFLAPEEQTDYHHLNAGDLDEEADQPKRKGMLDRIMRGIHARNGNR